MGITVFSIYARVIFIIEVSALHNTAKIAKKKEGVNKL